MSARRHRGRARINARTAWRLGAVALGMFAFGYLLVPLYDVLCEITGLNGKTGRIEAAAVSGPVDRTRTVTIEFVGQATSGLPWEFRPMTRSLTLHPGESAEVKYYARNRSGEAITAQAVPSVVPGRAASHFQKIECFCFTQQTLGPGEGREMPVRFVVNPGLSPEVQTITLSYAFFNTDKVQAQRLGARATQEEPHRQPAGG